MKIVFKVKCTPEAEMKLAVSGDIPQLGCWDVSKSLRLENKVANKWEGQAENIPEGKKFEFKLIKLYPNDRIVWQELPDNLNRKFKLKEDMVVTMEWSSPKGQRKALRTASYLKIKGLPSVSKKPSNIVISGPVSKDSANKDFDPFKDAEHSDSDPQIVLQKNPSTRTNIFYDRKEFESIFYSYTKTQGTSPCSKNLQSLHVVSRKSIAQDKFCQEIYGYLRQSFKCKIFWYFQQETGVQLQSQKNLKLVPILSSSQPIEEKQILQAYQKKLTETLSQHCLVLILDLSLASLQLDRSINGLLLGSLSKEQICHLQTMNLQSIKFVSFTQTKDTKLYLELSMHQNSSPQHQEAHHRLQLKLIEKVHEQGNQAVDLLLFEMRQQLIETMHGTYYFPLKGSVADIDRIISQSSSSLFIVDLKVIEQSKNRKVLTDRLKELSTYKGKLVCFFTWKTRDQLEKEDKDILNSNFFIVADDGCEVRLNNQWFDVMERHRRNIQILRKKFKDNIAQHGGEQELHAFSLTYKNSNPPLIKKLGEEIKNMLLEQKYIKVSVTDELVKTSWRLNEGHKTLEAITQLRCMAEGSLNLIFVIIKDPKKDCVFRDMDNLNIEFPFFKENSQKLYIIEGARETDRAQYYIEASDVQELKFGNI